MRRVHALSNVPNGADPDAFERYWRPNAPIVNDYQLDLALLPPPGGAGVDDDTDNSEDPSENSLEDPSDSDPEDSSDSDSDSEDLHHSATNKSFETNESDESFESYSDNNTNPTIDEVARLVADVETPNDQTP